ncbi:histidine kinase [Kitasatospora sp. NPDC002227]|uniref:sensor histidine kinase n=1 Tax=Kitasatospora sp. NPDC002227 TaxID=3154773 RepID=UPI00331BBFF0
MSSDRRAGRARGLTSRRAERLREQGRLEERARIARDVHDTVAQSLLALTLMIRAAEQALPAGADTARARLGTAYETAVLGLGQGQDLIGGVAASQLEHGGLTAALERYADLVARHLTVLKQLREAHPDGPCGAGPVPELELRVSGPVRRLPLPAESAALRAVQESVANAVRHAGAARITVELAYLADRVRLLVGDDGAGAVAAGGPGLGLSGMAQRVGRSGGRLRVDSRPGGGTVVAVEFSA